MVRFQSYGLLDCPESQLEHIEIYNRISLQPQLVTYVHLVRSAAHDAESRATEP